MMKPIKHIAAATALTATLAMGLATGIATAQDAEEAAEAEAPATAPAAFAGVQGLWAMTDEACAENPWQIADSQFIAAPYAALCSFEPGTVTESTNRSNTVVSFHTPSSCEIGDASSQWNYYFMLSGTGQTLWVSASNGFETTLFRCAEGASAGPADGPT